MKAKIKYITIFVFFVMATAIGTFGQNDVSIQAESEKKCSSIDEGLQFCTTSPFVSIKSGGQVHIDISIQNMTEKDTSIIHGNFYDYYDTTVTDSNSSKVLSRREIILQKYKEKTATPEEIGELLPINSMPRTVILAL